METRLNAAVAAFPPEIRGQAVEVGEQPSSFGYRKPMVGGPKPDVGSQAPEARVETSDDVGEDAEVATSTEAVASSTHGNAGPQSSEEEGYNWPEGAEVAAEVAAPCPEAVHAPLPTLDELVKRIPSDVQDTLENLFRVKFVSVKRVSPTSLKS